MTEQDSLKKVDLPSITVTDRRPRFEETPPGGTQPTEAAPRYPSFVAELKEKALASETKLAEALNLLRKREAEAEEFRVRLRREMERRSRAEMENWLKNILEVMDSLDRGIASASGSSESVLREGLGKIREQFLTILSRHEVRPMELLGTIYDPHSAEAVAISPAASREEDSKIFEELRKGYSIGGSVLRPAQVRVARASEDTISESEQIAPPLP
jgi:molecular chaperone GrpE